MSYMTPASDDCSTKAERQLLSRDWGVVLRLFTVFQRYFFAVNYSLNYFDEFKMMKICSLPFVGLSASRAVLVFFILIQINLGVICS